MDQAFIFSGAGPNRKTLKKLLSALRSTCTIDQDSLLVSSVKPGELMDTIIDYSMELSPLVFNFHLNQKQVNVNSPKWKKITPLVKSFLSSVLLCLFIYLLLIALLPT